MFLFTNFVHRRMQEPSLGPPGAVCLTAGNGHIVPFHEQLLPHWRAFAKWLQEDKEGREFEILLSNLRIPKVSAPPTD